MPSIETLLEIATLAGTEEPAFIALWNQVTQAFSPLDQQKLRDGYERAQAVSDEQHAAAQATTGKAK